MKHAPNPNYAERIARSFDKQQPMRLINASIPVIEKGSVEIHVLNSDSIKQQDGFVHGGVVGMIADTAAGYAAMTTVAAHDSVLTIEYKINFVSPGIGDKLIARAGVIKSGRTLILAKVDVFAARGNEEFLCAVMQQTLIVMHGSGNT